MNEQSPMNQDGVFSLDTAVSEFSNAYGLCIGKLIMEKLVLLEENSKLKAEIVRLMRELNLVKPQPESVG